MPWASSSQNLTGLGGPMGSERVTSNWRRHFYDLDTAKRNAEDDYRESRRTAFYKQWKAAGKSEAVARAAGNAEAAENWPGAFKWVPDGQGGFRTPDLGYVRYVIRPFEFEDEPE